MSIPEHLLDAPTWSSMLARWVGRDEPAVITSEATWSGDELLARSAGAVDHLRSLGAEPGVPVPALLTASPAAFAYTIGGAASRRPLAPLGARLTVTEVSACIDGLPVGPALLADEESAPLAVEVASRTGRKPVIIGPPARSELAPEPDPSADDIAFVLHTSGTTGRPKPVGYRQGSLAARVRLNTAVCRLVPGCVYATASPFHHIAGLGNHAVALATGAAVVPVARFTVDAWRSLAELGTTHALCVPTVLEMLLDAGALALPELRVLQYGAAPIHRDTLRRALDAIPGVGLVNIYGQTEGSPITVLGIRDHELIASGGEDEVLASVGWPPEGVELVIEDPDHRGIGEVTARGAHLFAVDQDGWLRTGDLGRLGARSELHLLGRKGDMIVRGGENVYPDEVERVLVTHPAVRDVAVVGIPDRRWGETVRAVVVATDATRPPAPEDLRDHARGSLAGFKVPTSWMFADALPRNAGGKVLRHVLVDHAAEVR